jgi:acetoacetate decarboxylase
MIFLDDTELSNIQWLMESEELLGFTLIRLRTSITVANYTEGPHDLTVRLKSQDGDYAKAYFFIQK